MSSNVPHLAGTALRAPAGSTEPGEQAGLQGALEALAAALSAHGWTAHVRTVRGRLPGVRAGNPEPGAAALSEDIYARPGPAGGWEYWWPWAQRIAGDPAAAAAVIVRVLRPEGTP
jgi:hypothetical protein